jgi:hypothetical protein
VARRVEVSGAGVRLRLRKLDRDRLQKAVHDAMDLKPGADRVAHAFASAGGPAAAGDALEALAAGRTSCEIRLAYNLNRSAPPSTNPKYVGPERAPRGRPRSLFGAWRTA